MSLARGRYTHKSKAECEELLANYRKTFTENEKILTPATHKLLFDAICELENELGRT